MGAQHAADAPAAHAGVGQLGQFRAQAARAVALAVIGKDPTHRCFPDGLRSGGLHPLLPSIVGAQAHAQRVTEPLHGVLVPTLVDIVAGAHGAGWPKMTKAFFKIPNSWASRLLAARNARASGSRATSTRPATGWACCQR